MASRLGGGVHSALGLCGDDLPFRRADERNGGTPACSRGRPGGDRGRTLFRRNPGFPRLGCDHRPDRRRVAWSTAVRVVGWRRAGAAVRRRNPNRRHPGRNLQDRGLALDPGNSALHAHRISAGRRWIERTTRQALSRPLCLDARWSRRRHDARLRVLFDVHRRLRRHDSRAGWAASSRPDAKRTFRAIFYRARDVYGLYRASLSAKPRRDPLRHCRAGADQRSVHRRDHSRHADGAGRFGLRAGGEPSAPPCRARLSTCAKR